MPTSQGVYYRAEGCMTPENGVFHGVIAKLVPLFKNSDFQGLREVLCRQVQLQPPPPSHIFSCRQE